MYYDITREINITLLFITINIDTALSEYARGWAVEKYFSKSIIYYSTKWKKYI